MENTSSSEQHEMLAKKDMSGTNDETDPTPLDPSRPTNNNGQPIVHPEKKQDEIGEVSKPTGLALFILVSAVFFAAFLMALNGSIIATAIPQITSHFNSLNDIGWYGSAYLISTCSLQPLVGKFYTHFPIKQTYLIFVSLFSLGSLIAGVATSSNMVIVGRAIQGIGGAGVINGTFITISVVAPKENKPLLIGIGMACATIGSVIGPLIGGALTQKVSWRWCFYINLPPSGFVLCVLLSLAIPEQMEKKPVRLNFKSIILEELDFTGFAFFAPACVMLLLAVTWGGQQYRWGSSTIIGLFCGSFAMFIVFSVWEVYRGEKAMIPPTIARNRLVIFGCFTSCFQMGSSLLLSYYLPLWFQVVKNASPTMSGVMILPTAISQGFGAVIAGKFVQVIGYCTSWALIGCMLTSVGAGLMTTFVPSTGAGPWIGYQILVGTGRGSVLQMPITAIQNLLPAKEISIATSQVFFFQYLGGAVFIAIGDTIFSTVLRASLHKYAPGADPQDVIDVGASSVRSNVSAVDLPGVLRAYDYAIVDTFYLAVGGSCAAFLTSFGMGWQKLPQQKKDQKKTDGGDP
ncbi:uncharacterized protein Z518_02452 [Rhinocladiella mackenziei CBS 650.93]|uniref:Major facilitator superfamily (MFS) profile domain-containing protein n=1 Tax=Rhinocladiella mackenziei CBS 650.93 TaxID=1442369 RepID=A0A0D2HBJ2_9EURO|nr:uncharacterized protein Z518_02452 [Rhinocladiella mackenziei CBS 650.93]KIX07798.1 hypothetical protein Z518_02452 [Rhinocladiella mackenziei CBS 650.93]